MTKQIKRVAKASTSKQAIKASTNNNKSKADDKPADTNNNNKTPDVPVASVSKEATLIYLFSKKQELPVNQLTAEQVGSEYKPEVTNRLSDEDKASGRPYMKQTHEAIGQLVMSIPGNGEDVLKLRMEAVYNMNEDDVSDEDKSVFDTPLAAKLAVNQDTKDAWELGKKFDEETQAHMVQIIEGRKIYEGGFDILNKDWERQFCTKDENGVVVVDPCLKMPRAGSGTKRNPQRGNERTDYWTVETDTKKVSGSVIHAMVIGSPIGAPFNQFKEIRRKAAANHGKVSQVDAIRVREICSDPKLAQHLTRALDLADDFAWNTLDKAVNRDTNTCVSRWRQTIGYRQQCAAIRELPGCDVQIVGEDIGGGSAVPTPIQIMYAQPGQKFGVGLRPITIAQFLKIDVPAAKLAAELEGKSATPSKKVPVTSGHLMATLKKAPKPGADNNNKEKPAVAPVIRTMDELEDGVNAISLFFQTKGSLQQIEAVLNKNDDKAKLLAASLCPIYDEIGKIEGALRVLYILWLAEQSTKNQQENIEKINAIDPDKKLDDTTTNNKQKAKVKAA